MEESLISKSSISIHAPAAQVWLAITDPVMVKQWMFGTELKTDWKVGSPITYTGEWEGKPYEDKGVVEAIEEGKFVTTKYWSAAFGTEDKPENYVTVTYSIEDTGEDAVLTITQEGNKDAEATAKSQSNWNYVLDTLKKLVEAPVQD